MTDRERFEDWAERLMLDPQGGDYLSHHARLAWFASRKQALEEAMAECNKLATHEQDMGRSKEAFGCDLCVGSLAELATPEGEQG